MSLANENIDFLIWATSLVLMVTFSYLLSGLKKIHTLETLSTALSDKWPLVSIIIPIRNEERNLEEALRSVLALEYNPIEIIAVNDRSSDQSLTLLKKIQQAHPQLKIIDIQKLPDGWLGKNHALHQGLKVAAGDYVLFTDADVVFAPSVLSLAMNRILQTQRDHLAAFISIKGGTFFLNIFQTALGICITLYTRPWLYSDKKSSAALGIGAFNLFYKKTLLERGGLESVRDRPDEDLQLAKTVKKFGHTGECVSAVNLLSVEWYQDLPEAINAFEKNLFAGFDFSTLKAIGGMFGTFCLFIVPPLLFLLSCFLNPHFILLGLIPYLILVSLSYLANSRTGLPKWSHFFVGIGGSILLYTLIRNISLTLIRGGYYWRGTFYPLKRSYK